MSKLALTLSSGFVNAFLAEAEIPEADLQTLLIQAGISSSSLQTDRGRITEEQFSALYRCIAAKLDDELPNLLSHPIRGGAMKIAGLAIISAPTMGTAIHRYAQFLRGMVHDFDVLLIRGPDVSAVTLTEPDGARRCKPMAIEMTLKAIHGLASWLVGREFPLGRVDFAFSRPPYADELRNLFPGPIYYEQACSRFVVDSSLLDLRVQRNVDDLRAFLARQPRDWICVPETEHLMTLQVRDYLLRHDLGKVSIDQVAKALTVSNRTLFRRLEVENTSFQQVKDDVRRDLAISRLTTSEASIAEIAFELGFSDTSSFHRAFRTWTGTTAGAYRDGVADDDGPRLQI